MKKFFLSFLFMFLFIFSPVSLKLFAKSPYYSLGYTIPLRLNAEYMAIIDSSRCGFEFAIEDQADDYEFSNNYLIDYQKNYTDGKNLNGILFGNFLSFGVCDFFEPYVGAGLGITYGENNFGFSWKLNTGFRIPMEIFCIRFDLSCSNVLGFAGTVCVGVR